MSSLNRVFHETNMGGRGPETRSFFLVLFINSFDSTYYITLDVYFTYPDIINLMKTSTDHQPTPSINC